MHLGSLGVLAYHMQAECWIRRVLKIYTINIGKPNMLRKCVESRGNWFESTNPWSGFRFCFISSRDEAQCFRIRLVIDTKVGRKSFVRNMNSKVGN